MKKYLKIFLFISLVGIFFNSCKKANFPSIDPNLEGGTWNTSGSDPNSGAYIQFSGSNHIEFEDRGNSSSNEDNLNISGDAKEERKGILKVGWHKFELIVKPVPCYTTIYYGGTPINTNWMMQIRVDRKPTLTLYR